MGVKYVKDFDYPSEGGFHKSSMPSRAMPNAPARGAAKMESNPKMGKGQGYAKGGKVQKFANGGPVSGYYNFTQQRLPPELQKVYDDARRGITITGRHTGVPSTHQQAMNTIRTIFEQGKSPVSQVGGLRGGKLGAALTGAGALGAAGMYGIDKLMDYINQFNQNRARPRVTVEEINQPQGRARGGMMKKHMAAKGRMKGRK